METSDDEPVLYEAQGPLALLTLNRPAKLNAINGAVIGALHEAMDRAESDPRVRVIVLRGAGRAFSAGFDLEENFESARDSDDPLRSELERDFDIIMRFWDSPKPTIASLHGVCLGGAMEMALACDLSVSTADCRMGEPEVTFGSGVVAMLLPWICGPKRAAEFLLTGETGFDGTTAREYGIVNRVVGENELEQETLELALSIARNDVVAVQGAKRAIHAAYDKAGMREAMRDGLEQCIEVDREHSDEVKHFHAIAKDQGTRAAIAWLDQQLNSDERQDKHE